MSKRIFVFGSNLAGLHGAGSARAAYDEHGAVWGVGHGPTGSAYAIPTKDESIETMETEAIAPYVAAFVVYATNHPGLVFDVVKIGCGLARKSESEMAALFKGAPLNVNLPDGWREIAESHRSVG